MTASLPRVARPKRIDGKKPEPDHITTIRLTALERAELEAMRLRKGFPSRSSLLRYCWQLAARIEAE